jgi:hypothetical protein
MTSRYREEFNASFRLQTFKAESIWLAGSDRRQEQTFEIPSFSLNPSK